MTASKQKQIIFDITRVNYETPNSGAEIDTVFTDIVYTTKWLYTLPNLPAQICNKFGLYVQNG